MPGITFEQLSYTVFIIFAFIILLVFVRTKYSAIISFLNFEDDNVIKLKMEIKELQKEVTALRTLVNILIERINNNTNATVNAANLVTTMMEDKTVKKESIHTKIVRPVLLVYGTGPLGESDRNAMRRAGVAFFRLNNAKLAGLSDEIQRRRSDGTLYDIVHISAHGQADGTIDMNGQLVSGEELSDAMAGINCVFLSTCSNHYLADKLVGVVKYVIVVYEEIQVDDAANFVYEFYKRYKVNRNIDASFAEAIAVSPSISEFVDLRVGSN